MSQPILFGVEMDRSATAAVMLRMAGDFLVQVAPRSQVLLLTVIPVPYDKPSALGRFRGQAPSLSATLTQRTEARHALQIAQTVFAQSGIAAGRLEMLLREGIPTEELVQVATERQVGCIVLGHRGFSLGQRLRRLLLGSTTAQVLRQAPCPVILVPFPPGSHPLVAWYEEALTCWLSDHPSGFFIFTPKHVATSFPPAPHIRIGRKDLLAAKEALQHLEDKGVLMCQRVNGIWQCFND